MKDLSSIRKDFPIFEKHPELVYLDSAATALKPGSVLDAMNAYYTNYSSNVGRGIYPLAEEATIAYEEARQKVIRFVQADEAFTAIFTANATHAINLVALGLEESVQAEHAIVVTALEHHSNYLPWKELAKRKGARFLVAPFESDGRVAPEKVADLVDRTTRIVALSAVSNVFGVINPVADIIKKIREKNPKTLVLVDACQAMSHIPVRVKDWNADFIVFSGHKVFGPTGIGAMVGKKQSLDLLTPKNVGGGTVLDAWSETTVYRDIPERLEGGTPNIAGAIGLGAALDYLSSFNWEEMREHEEKLITSLIKKLKSNFGSALRILGSETSADRAGLVAFTLEGIHPHDLAHLLGEQGICVRAGEQCAGPLHHALGIPATTRVSLSMYNTEADIDRLIAGMKQALSVMKQ